MHAPPLFRDRSRPVQVPLGGIVPSPVAVLAGIGSFLAGFEHRDGWGGTDGGGVGGAIYADESVVR